MYRYIKVYKIGKFYSSFEFITLIVSGKNIILTFSFFENIPVEWEKRKITCSKNNCRSLYLFIISLSLKKA